MCSAGLIDSKSKSEIKVYGIISVIKFSFHTKLLSLVSQRSRGGLQGATKFHLCLYKWENLETKKRVLGMKRALFF